MIQRTFLKNFAVTSVSNLIILIIALLNNVLITRWLGPEGRGIYAVVLTIVIFINLVFGDGIRRSNTIIIGRDNSTLKHLVVFNIYYSLFLFLLLSILFQFRFLVLSFLPNISSTLLWFAFMISIFTIFWQAIQAIYLGLQKIFFFNVLMVSSVLLILLLNYVGIMLFKISLFGILQNILISSILVSILGLMGLKRNDEITKNISSSYRLVKQFLLSTKSTLSAIANYLVLRSGIFFVNAILGKAETGLFSVAFIFFDLIMKIPNVAGTLIFSKIAKEKEKASFDSIAKVIRIILFFNVLVSFIYFFFGQDLITFLFGNEFYESSNVLKYMIFGLIFSGPGSVIHSYFMGIGFPRRMLIQNITVAIFALVSNYIFIHLYGLIGASISYSLIFSFWSIYYIILFLLVSKLKFRDVLILKSTDVLIIKEYLLSFFKNKKEF